MEWKKIFIKIYNFFDESVKELQLVSVNMLPPFVLLLIIVVVSIHGEDNIYINNMIIAYKFSLYLFIVWLLNRYFKKYFFLIKDMFRKKGE